MGNQIFFHHDFIHQEEGLISVRDLSLLRGYGIFDYFKTLWGKPLFLKDYLSRFINSAAAMHLPLNYTMDELSDIIDELIQRNGMQEDTGIRMVLSGGVSVDSMGIGEPQLIIMQEALPLSDPSAQGQIKSYPYLREAPFIKTINYGLPIRLRAEGMLDGYTDVLYFTESGITETSRCNVFMVSNGVLYTPSNDILYGVTRRQVIQCAKEAGFAVREEPISLSTLLEADECFITSTTKGVLPIKRVDDTLFQSSEITEKLRSAFKDWCLASL